MTPLAFEQQYHEEWTELEQLLDALRARPWRGAVAGVSGIRLATLYRRACGHLALARARSYPAHLIDRLERMTSDSHQLIYHRREYGLRQFARIFTVDFPAAVRANASYVAVAAAVFFVPAIALGLIIYGRSDLILAVVSSEQAAQFEEMYSASADSIGRRRDANTDWMMFGYYIRNNIGISFQCFAAGLFVGLGSIFFLAFNGAFGGALAGYLTERGLSGTFWPFVATHSSFELTAIVLSGAAGLKIGHALIAPGRLTRRHALVRAARESAPILYGITAMLVIAAAVEAFWSSSQWLPSAVRYAAQRPAGPRSSCTSPDRAVASRRIVQIDALAVRLRPRTPLEAADLGVRVCQNAARSVYTCLGVVAAPLFGLAFASGEIAPWLPSVLVWWLKPWLDRTILFVLSRAAFGQPTTVAQLWRAQGHVWWGRLWLTLTIRRVSPWRSLTEPIYQLEGLSLGRASARVRQIRHRYVWSALLMTQTFVLTEAALMFSALSLVFWFAPAGQAPSLTMLLGGEAPWLVTYGTPAAYMAAVFFVEPFFVAAGFAMYLNRRAELEAWDIEQEFRRAFRP